MPHGHCYYWTPSVVWLNVVSDSLVALAYYSIPLTLFYFTRKLTDLPYRWIFFAFAAFIVACGTTHVMEIWTVWHGTYRLAGVIKAGTAVLSVGTAILLVWIIPQALTLRSPSELARLNAELEQEILRRSKAEVALREADERLNLALRSANVGTWSWDLHSHVLTWDAYIHPLFGLEPGTFGGRYEDFEALLHPDERERISSEVKRSVNENVDFDTEFRVIKPDGSLAFISARGRVYADGAGRPTCMTGVCWDVSRSKHAEQALKETADALERSNKELAMFAYVASHDLQEPVRAVSGCVELLKRRLQDQLDDSSRELMTHITEGAVRMRTLIQDLLTYSHVGSKGKAFEPTDCEAILQIAQANLAVAIQESGAVITHDPLPQIIADPTQMVQLFQNLTGNAIKYRGDRAPVIHINATRQDDEWLFSVSDNGIGIDPQYFERIFVIFQRLHGRSEYSGTGIGLAVCKKIVERHHGRIWVESAADKGSRFCFTIPDNE